MPHRRHRLPPRGETTPNHEAGLRPSCITVYTIFTPWLHHVHTMFTPCSHHVHTCLHNVYTMSLQYTVKHLWNINPWPWSSPGNPKVSLFLESWFARAATSWRMALLWPPFLVQKRWVRNSAVLGYCWHIKLCMVNFWVTVLLTNEVLHSTVDGKRSKYETHQHRSWK
jgi:hypothetical protein